MGALSGKVVVVTGGTRGLGLVICEALREVGATVVSASRSSPTARLDVREERSVQDFFRRVDQAHGGLDALVCCAGTGLFRPVSALTLEEWRQVLQTNLDGAFLCAREAIPRLRARGGGRIVQVGSVAGAVGLPGMGAYGASKAGLRLLTEVINAEEAAHGIRATHLTVGMTDAGLAPDVPVASVSAERLPASSVGSAVVHVLSQPASVRIDEVRLVPPAGVL